MAEFQSVVVSVCNAVVSQHVSTFLPTADLVAAAERVPAIEMTL